MQTVNPNTNPHKVTKEFEEVLARYTGAPYVVALDNASNALFLSLVYDKVKGKEVIIPNHTYPSVPCEIIHAGGIVKFHVSPPTLKGSYYLIGTKVIDSALRFTYNMYEPDSFMCVSFTGPYKTFKLSKGGAILTDNFEAYLWFKRARFSGRRECSYHDDNFDMLGWNFYMEPEKAARGLLLMSQFYDPLTGKALEMQDVEMTYPDLSKFSIYSKQLEEQ